MCIDRSLVEVMTGLTPGTRQCLSWADFILAAVTFWCDLVHRHVYALPGFIPVDLVELQCTVSKAFACFPFHIGIHVGDSVKVKHGESVCVFTCRVAV